jgi:hypothetical protein
MHPFLLATFSGVLPGGADVLLMAGMIAGRWLIARLPAAKS